MPFGNKMSDPTVGFFAWALSVKNIDLHVLLISNNLAH